MHPVPLTGGGRGWQRPADGVVGKPPLVGLPDQGHSGGTVHGPRRRQEVGVQGRASLQPRWVGLPVNVAVHVAGVRAVVALQCRDRSC